MLYNVEDGGDFKEKNLRNWYQNSKFWLQGKMRHIKDVFAFTGKVLSDLLVTASRSHKPRVIDLGCGEAWILRMLRERQLEVDYLGIDFNKIFIESNQEKYGDSSTRFFLHDLEKTPPQEFVGWADVAINFFNFFEIPDIKSAFKHSTDVLSENGVLVVVSIDPIMQILSVSENFESFLASLKQYEKYQTQLGYDKDIDIGDEKSGRVYKSLLYSTATYVALANENNLKLFDYKEVVKTGNFVPQIYQYVFFKK